jgi:hypothetical protein
LDGRRNYMDIIDMAIERFLAEGGTIAVSNAKISGADAKYFITPESGAAEPVEISFETATKMVKDSDGITEFIK